MSYLIKFLKITLFLYFLIISAPRISVLHAEEQTDVYFIYSQRCPHFKNQAPHMHYLEANNKNITVEFLDIDGDKKKGTVHPAASAVTVFIAAAISSADYLVFTGVNRFYMT